VQQLVNLADWIHNGVKHFLQNVEEAAKLANRIARLKDTANTVSKSLDSKNPQLVALVDMLVEVHGFLATLKQKHVLRKFTRASILADEFERIDKELGTRMIDLNAEVGAQHLNLSTKSTEKILRELTGQSLSMEDVRAEQQRQAEQFDKMFEQLQHLETGLRDGAKNAPALEQRAQELVEKMAAELEVDCSDVKAVLEEIYGIGDKLNSVFESLSDQVCATITNVSCQHLAHIFLHLHVRRLELLTRKWTSFARRWAHCSRIRRHRTGRRRIARGT